jgi:hypothetical protein
LTGRGGSGSSRRRRRCRHHHHHCHHLEQCRAARCSRSSLVCWRAPRPAALPVMAQLSRCAVHLAGGTGMALARGWPNHRLRPCAPVPSPRAIVAAARICLSVGPPAAATHANTHARTHARTHGGRQSERERERERESHASSSGFQRTSIHRLSSALNISPTAAVICCAESCGLGPSNMCAQSTRTGVGLVGLITQHLIDEIGHLASRQGPEVGWHCQVTQQQCQAPRAAIAWLSRGGGQR